MTRSRLGIEQRSKVESIGILSRSFGHEMAREIPCEHGHLTITGLSATNDIVFQQMT